MQSAPIKDIEQEARRGLRVRLDHVLFRNYKWQPYLDIQLTVESVRTLPLRISAVDLVLSFDTNEVGPLPPITRPYQLIEPGEGIEIRLRKDLYPTLAQELEKPARLENSSFHVRGFIIVESPRYEGFIEYPVDVSYRPLRAGE